MRVRVPLGRSTLTGFVLSVTSQPETEGKPIPIRNVIARLEETPSVSPDLLSLAKWVADHYLAPLGQCLRLAFPGAPDTPKRRPKPGREPGAPRVSSGVPIPSQNLTPAFAALRKRALHAVTHRTHTSVLFPASTDEVTGFYLEAIQAVLETGRTTLVLLPEINRVEAFHILCAGRWGTQCQAYHGGLSVTDRRTAWARIQAGEATIVVGTRSASFAPLMRLGLIIVDQEDHPAYKGENVPRYDARSVAGERARRAGAVLVLASAHPSLESVKETETKWETIGEGPRSAKGPPVTVVDLRETSYGEILSTLMTDAIAACLEVGKKALLFLNRKGYAPVLLCRDCGQALRCPVCAVGWTYHKREGVLRCAHCGRTGGAPETCPACGGIRLVPSGFGTEALEEAVRTRFPTARVARLEGHREGGRADQERANAAILSLMRAGELDILIGTQIVVSRSPKPVASLIGLATPDAALHLPDFRAAERAYHLLREVMALADPDDPDARIVVQTFVPEHHVMRAVALQDSSVFYESELAARKALGYPPFGRLIGLKVIGKREDLVEAAAMRWGELLKTESGIEVLGPIPATPARVRGRVRWQLAVKGADEAALRHAVWATLAELESRGRAGGLRYDMDVDPQSLL